MILYGAFNKEFDSLELWSQMPIWADGAGWVGSGLVTILYDDDIPACYRDIISDGKVHEFEAMICLTREVQPCK